MLCLPRNMQLIFLKQRKSIAPATQNDCQDLLNALDCQEVPHLSRETRLHWKPPKVTTFVELAIGTAIRGSRDRKGTVANGCERLRTVANGCERLRTLAGVNAMFSEHTLHPQTPRVKRELLLRIREKFMKSGIFKIFTSRFMGIQLSMDMGVSETGRCAWHFVFFAFSEKPV